MSRLSLRRGLRSAVYGAPKKTAAAWSNAYSMYHDGTSDGWSSINTSTPTIDAFKGAFSVSYWINATAGQGTSPMHMWLSPPYDASAEPVGQRQRLQIRHLGNGGLLVRVGVGGSYNRSTYSSGRWATTSLGLWHKWAHVAITVSAANLGDVKIYINGTLDTTGTSAGPWASSEDIEVTLMAAFNAPGTFTNFKSGYQDEVSLYDSELSAADVAALYNQQPGSATGLPADPLSLGLTPKLYYRMGDLTDTGGASGVVVDRMGTGMDLDSLGAPVKSLYTAAWQAPTSSIAFDGTNDYALTGDMSASIPQGAHSVSWWMKAGTATGYDAYMWTGPKSASNYNFHRFLTTSQSSWTQTRTADGVNGLSRVNSNNHVPALNNGNWQHWCYTCSATSSSAGDVTLYVDGQSEITISGIAPAYLSTADFVMYLARWGTYAGDYAACNITEVTVWDYELSGTQVANLWNNDGSGNGTPTNPQDTTGISTGPVHYWRMGSNMSNSTTVVDEIGVVNLTLANGAATSGDVP